VRDWSSTRHVVLDLDGTIYRDGRIFPETLPFLERLRRLGIGYTYLTNNTSRSKAEYVLKLKTLGIEAREDEIYTPAESTIAYLRAGRPPIRRIALLGTPSLCQEFERAGFELTWDDPEAVIVAFDMTLTYERLCRAAYWIAQGRPFLATHPDFVCPTDQPTVLVDCGSICACLTAATGRRPVAVFGKPSPTILLNLCERLGLEPEQIVMVGDRIYTDMKMAREAGVPAALVLTGEATAEEARHLPEPPDYIGSDIGGLGELLENAKNDPAR
jgi:HAD superfamily hydrolase (TIGR01450 family)